WKKAILEQGSEATTITHAFTGLYARTLRNAFTEQYAAAGAPVLPSLLQSTAAVDVYTAANQQQNREYFPMHAGQSVGLIHDLPGPAEGGGGLLHDLRGAAEVVEALVREARAALRALNERVQLD